MTIRLHELDERTLELTVDGKLEADDYHPFRELADARIERFGSINLLLILEDFSGWTPTGLWEDLKFDVVHFSDVERLAIVGADDSQHWMAAASRPFTSALIRFFTFDEVEAARGWLRQSGHAGLRHAG